VTREPDHPGLLRVLAAFAAIYIIWGSTYLAIRFAIETMPPFLMAAGRFLTAGAIVYLWIRFHGGEKPNAKHWRSATVAGSLLLLGGNGGVVWAEQHVPSGVAALIIATVPLWMVAMEWARPGGLRPSVGVIGGILVGFLGVGVLVRISESGNADGIAWVPVLVLLVAAFSWSLGSLYSRQAALPVSPFLATSMQMLGGGAALLLVGLFGGELADLNAFEISVRSAGSLVYLILFGSILGFSAYVWLLRVVAPARVSTYAFVNPAVAVLLGWLFASEPLTGRILLATGLIIVAVVLVVMGKRERH
jgi:drug/metabolite transporter (DMT)-like permease